MNAVGSTRPRFGGVKVPRPQFEEIRFGTNIVDDSGISWILCSDRESIVSSQPDSSGFPFQTYCLKCELTETGTKNLVKVFDTIKGFDASQRYQDPGISA